MLKNLGNKDPDCLLCQLIGDPINYMTGSFYQEEHDYAGVGPDPLRFGRSYNSQDTTTHEFGAGWHGAYSRAIATTSSTIATATRDDGRVFTFTLTNGAWVGDADVNSRLMQTASGWQYVSATDETETYNNAGQLLTVSNRAGLTQTMGYDSVGRLSSVTDPFGRVLNLSYPSATSPLITGIIRPDGTSFAYGYDSSNRLISVTDANGKVRQYLYENTSFPTMLTGIIDENGSRFLTVAYDANGLAISSQHSGGADLDQVNNANLSSGSVAVTNPLGAVTTYGVQAINGSGKATQTSFACSTCSVASGTLTDAYDANGNVTSEVDYRGNATAYSYEARNLETSRTLASGEVISTSWTPTFHLPAKISEPGRTTSFSYDTNGNLLAKTIATATMTSSSAWTYNSAGQPLTATDPDGNVTQFAYDGAGNLASSTDALGHVTQVTSTDANGRPLSITDANGVVTSLTYNFRGQVLSRTTGVRVTSYSYDPVGQLTKLTNPDGSTLTFAYDAAHRLTGVTDALGNRIAYTLDAAGNRTLEQVFAASGTQVRTHSYAYDGLSRMSQDIGAAGQTANYSYDANGNLTDAVDPNGNDTQRGYDSVNRIIAQATGGQTIAFAYDAKGRLGSVTDARGLVTSYANNALDEQQSIASPDTGTTTRSFDAAGNVLTSTDANHKTTSYAYDALNRVVRMTTSSGGVFSYQYDQGTYGIGHLTAMNDPTSSTVWGYNKYGQVNFKQQVIGANVLTTRYAYTASTGLLASITYPSGAATSYSYNANGQVSAIAYTPAGSTTAYSLVANVAWKPFGPVKAWTMGNGASYARTFDQDYRIATIAMPSVAIALGYDANSNITAMTETGLPQKTFAYDARNRITGFIDGAGSQTYSYDPNSDNRTGLAINNGGASTTLNYSYDAASNHLLGVSGASPESYSYDAAGNTLSHVTPTGTTSFAYNARNRLAQVNAGGAIMSYNINGLGQRLTKNPAGSSNPTLFAYGEDGQIMGRYNATVGSEETVYLAGTPVALIEPGTAYFIAPDQLSAPHQITNTAGQQVWLWDHDPFGNGTPSGALTTYHGRFPGQFYDGEDGLHYNYFRDYNPATGRYIESDPVGLRGGINTYVYAGGNPVNHRDAKGLEDHEGSPAPMSFSGPDYANNPGILQILLPVTTAPFSQNPIGGSMESQIEYGNQVNCLRYNEYKIANFGINAMDIPTDFEEIINKYISDKIVDILLPNPYEKRSPSSPGVTVPVEFSPFNIDYSKFQSPDKWVAQNIPGG